METKYGDGRRTVRHDDNIYARMVTPSDQVRRLRRVLDVLVALASVLDGRSRVVDGRVQLDLSVLGTVLGRHGSRLSRGALAELFRWHDDRRPEIHRPYWGEQRHYVFILRGDPDLRQELAELISSALQYWSAKIARLPTATATVAD